MSYFKPQSSAEVTDRLADLTGLAVGLAALVYIISVVQNFVAPGMAELLDTAQLVGGILILAVYLPLLVFFKTRFGGQSMTPWKTDGFMASVFERAGFKAFRAHSA